MNLVQLPHWYTVLHSIPKLQYFSILEHEKRFGTRIFVTFGTSVKCVSRIKPVLQHSLYYSGHRDCSTYSLPSYTGSWAASCQFLAHASVKIKHLNNKTLNVEMLKLNCCSQNNVHTGQNTFQSKKIQVASSFVGCSARLQLKLTSIHYPSTLLWKANHNAKYADFKADCHQKRYQFTYLVGLSHLSPKDDLLTQRTDCAPSYLVNEVILVKERAHIFIK